MTPLKKPITVTIETAEELLSLWHRTNAGTGNLEAYLKQYPTTHVDLMYQVAQPLWKKVDLLCKDAAIDPLKWNPPTPLIVAGHEPTFNPDGSVKVGCQTIPKETMELVVKRWQEAGNVEDVWPKFYRSRYGGHVRFDNEDDAGTWNSGSKAAFRNHAHCATHEDMKPIANPEAARILGKEQKEEWPKWFQKGGYVVFRIDSETTGKSFYTDEKAWGNCNWSLAEINALPQCKPITREQAESLIGKQSLTSPE